MTLPFLEHLLPGTTQLQPEHYELDTETAHLTITVCSTQDSAQCPLCSTLSRRVHSQYQRTLADLPCVDFALSLLVHVCKFFCDNPSCKRRIFTERLPTVAAPWARKTARLVERVQRIGIALGGAAGARLAHQIGVRVCGSTLLNHLKPLSLPELKVPKILGVDDFAFRRGHHYGTILVDLETHRPIALLPDRKADTLADWLKAHPGVEVLSRDRSKAYKSGMSQGAPNAIQVADRFHLAKNLEETLEVVFKGYQSELKGVEQQHRQQTAAPQTVVVQSKATATASAQAQTKQAHHQRRQQQQRIKTLSTQHVSQVEIAQQVGVSVRTVQRLLRLPDLSETPSRRPSFGRSLLDPYKERLVDWWNQGIRAPKTLMNLLQQDGYPGSERTLTRYTSTLRAAQGLPPTRVQPPQDLPPVSDPPALSLTPRQAAFLVVKREENREAEETELLERLVKCHPDLTVAVELTQSFLSLLRDQQAQQFDRWLAIALNSSLKPFQSFANGLMEDYAAVKASMMSNVSNGPVEGLNNRLKMLKRQMFGRASLELLEKRFILA